LPFVEILLQEKHSCCALVFNIILISRCIFCHLEAGDCGHQQASARVELLRLLQRHDPPRSAPPTRARMRRSCRKDTRGGRGDFRWGPHRKTAGGHCEDRKPASINQKMAVQNTICEPCSSYAW